MSPQTGRRIHLTLMILWVIPGIPVSFWLRRSVVGHWSGWSAERPSEVVES